MAAVKKVKVQEVSLSIEDEKGASRVINCRLILLSCTIQEIKDHLCNAVRCNVECSNLNDSEIAPFLLPSTIMVESKRVVPNNMALCGTVAYMLKSHDHGDLMSKIKEIRDKDIAQDIAYMPIREAMRLNIKKTSQVRDEISNLVQSAKSGLVDEKVASLELQQVERNNAFNSMAMKF
jgi:hypothetical protein